jgi:hypothetical protein
VDPMWGFLKLHMEMTLGARLIDHLALAGQVPHETALADGIGTSLSRIVRVGARLLLRYAHEGTRALFSFSKEPVGPLLSYRRTALDMLRFTVSAFTAARVFRRGVRNKDRGRVATGDAWQLLADVLGPEVRKVHPLIVKFYSNPSSFVAQSSLRLETAPARFWSFVVTSVLGQGLYETGRLINTRFSVFRRADGSMHFIRQLVVDNTLRHFDSDFVVREHRGRPTLFEVFPELGLSVAMQLTVREGGGLSIRGAEVWLRRWRLPMLGLSVEFISEVANSSAQTELNINGHLRMEPTSALGRFWAYRVLRRPRELGCIHYRLTPGD